MNIEPGVFASLFLIGFSFWAFYSARKGKYSGFRLKFLGIIGILVGMLAINSVLLVIAPRVTYELKDALFGTAGGILFVSFMVNVLLGGTLLGLFWNLPVKSNTNNVVAKISDVDVKNKFPAWFNNLSHTIIGMLSGSSIAALLIAFFKNEKLGQGLEFLGLYGIIFSAVYVLALIVYLIIRKRGGSINQLTR